MMNPWFIDPLHITIRLALAVLMGGLIGFEREQSSHAAGLRTHILVCLGATLVMLLSMYGFADFAKLDNVRLDPARLAAQVISGIGFLGAGTILYTGKSITGLTTAASLWVVAAIGLAVGAGFLYAAGLACLFALMSLFVLNILEKKYLRAKKLRHIKLEALDAPGMLSKVSALLVRQGHDIQKLSVEESSNLVENLIAIQMTIRLAKGAKVSQTVDDLHHLEGVRSVACD